MSKKKSWLDKMVNAEVGKVRRRVAKATGIPTTRAGRKAKVERTVGRAAMGGGCSLFFIAFWSLSALACCCLPGDDKAASAPTAKPVGSQPAPDSKIATDSPVEKLASAPAELAKEALPLRKDEAPEQLDLKTIYGTYLPNKAAGDAKYRGRVVEVIAVVHSTGNHFEDGPYAVLEGGPKGLVITAWFSKDRKQEIVALNKGQTVRIRGKVDKAVVMQRDASVIFSLDDAVLVEIMPVADPTPARKATYIRIVAAMAKVEDDAVAKYGRKPKADDKAGFTVPYKAFVESETYKALGVLADELGLKRPALDAIQAEGDENKWPKK